MATTDVDSTDAWRTASVAPSKLMLEVGDIPMSRPDRQRAAGGSRKRGDAGSRRWLRPERFSPGLLAVFRSRS